MQERTRDILLIVIIILLLTGGILLFFQQKSIGILQKTVLPEAGSGVGASRNLSASQKEKLPKYLIEITKKDIIDNTKDITGEVKQIKDGTLTVEALVVDLGKVSEASSTAFEALPKIKKTFNIATNQNTDFLVKKINEIAVGEKARIYVSQSVYQAGDLTATRVICPLIGNNKMTVSVNAKVEEVKGDSLVVKDAAKENQKYILKVVSETVIFRMDPPDQAGGPAKKTDLKLSDLKPGDNVLANVSGDVKSQAELEARTIIIMSPSP